MEGEEIPEASTGEQGGGPPMNDSWYGRPVEEVDPVIFEDTFCVISMKFDKHYVYRFSSTKSLFLLGPLNPIRKFAIYVTTHRWFDFLIIMTILANCVTLAMTTNMFDDQGNKIDPPYDYYTDRVEYAFLAVYTLELIMKVLAKGFVCNKFSYLRNRWNCLDFIVVVSGYVTIVQDLRDNDNKKEDNALDFLRTFRVLRAVKTISIMPGLKMMINALLSSVVQLLEVMVLTVTCLMIFSLFAQELFMGKLRQKCVIDKGGINDPDRIMHTKKIEDEPDDKRDEVWTMWVSDWNNWKRRDFPAEEPTQCGNGSDTRQCGEGYTCIGQLGENPDDGWTHFETFFNAMLSTFQLLTLDYWERLYDVVVSTCGVWSLIFFILVIFLGAYYLLNLMLAVVAMSYENEAQLQDQGPASANEKLSANRKGSNFSFDELSKLNICKLTQFRQRSKSEKERLALRMKRSGFVDAEQQEGKENIHLDDAIMNLLGMRMNLAQENEKLRNSTGEKELGAEDLDEAKGTENVSGSLEVEKGSRSEADLESPTRPSWYSRWKAAISAKLQQILQPVVNHHFFEYFITGCIILNTICLALEHHGQNKDWDNLLKIGNNVFMAVFTSEFILKLLALQGEYFQSGWNLFDMLIVIVSYIDLAIPDSGGSGSGSRGLSVIRSMRLLRVFKLAQSWVTMKILLNIIFSSFGALGNLTLVLLIVIYIFAVMGMQTVGDKYTLAAFGAEKNPEKFPKWHWRHFWYAFMMVFRVLCGEWIEAMWECLQAQEYYIEQKKVNAVLHYGKCFVIYLPILIVGNFIVLNLFLALLLNSFDTEELNAQREKELEASGRTENLKNIVGLLMTKKEGDVTESEIEDSAQKGQDDTKSASTPAASHVHLTKKVSTHVSLQEPPARKRFKAAVNRIILQLRIMKAERAIARAENKIKKNKHKLPPSLFLKNPAMKGSSYDYDRTPESSQASVDLTAPGECFPSNSWICVKCCAKTNEASTRRQNYLRNSLWDKTRSWCVHIVSHSAFEYAILLLIFASSITLCFEDIHLDSKPKLKTTLCYVNYGFTCIFCIEMVLKIMAIGVWGYFTSFWTLLDAFIVIVSLVSLYFDITLDACKVTESKSGRTGAAANLGALKALRTLRALRPLRAISRWQGMKIVVNALMYAIPSIFNVLLVCLLFWLIFSIMGVQFFKGQFYRCVDDSGERVGARVAPNKDVCCAKADTHGYSWVNTISNYDNVFEGYLSLLQIATFEGWMELMSYSVDAVGVDKQPVTDYQIWVYIYYVIFIIFGSFFTLQLFIGVIIDNFNMLKKKYEGNMLEVLLTPTQRNYYIAMKNLGRRKPMPVILRPKSPFFGFFYDMAMNRKLEIVIFIMIFLNMVMEAFEYYKQSQVITHITDGLNVVFTAVYVLEAIIKIVGLGTFYFTVPWNVYDFVLVIASLVDVFLVGDLTVVLPLPPTMLRIVRVFRIGRILRLVKAAQGIRKLLFALVVSLPALFNIGALLALITFIYAILGMALFGKAPRKWSIDDVFNFETFMNACLLLLRLMTAAGWNEVLDSLTVVEPICGSYRHIQCGLENENECPSRPLVVAYIVSYLILTYLIVINLYIAIILENYVEASNEEDVGIVEDDLDMFYNRWARFDPFATHFIDFSQLPDFLDSLDPPLQLPKPNIVAIVAFNLPIARGNKIHCLDILQALIKHVLGQVDDSREFRKLQSQMEHKFQKQFPTRRMLDIVSSSRQWKIEQNAAIIIQRAWRAYLARKHAKEQKEHPAEQSKGTVKSTKSHGGLGHMMSRMGNVQKRVSNPTSTK